MFPVDFPTNPMKLAFEMILGWVTTDDNRPSTFDKTYVGGMNIHKSQLFWYEQQKHTGFYSYRYQFKPSIVDLGMIGLNLSSEHWGSGMGEMKRYI